jgi:hypothetical protein
VINKIKKLLSLAEGNQNEHERDVAMKFAMELLAKHNLTMETFDGQPAHDRIEEVHADFKLEPWITTTLDAACNLYYTDFYIHRTVESTRFDYWTGRIVRKYRNTPVFFGRAENIAVTIDVATWLLNSVRSESNKLYRDAASRRSFRVGASDRLYVRADKLVQEEKATQEGAVGNALVVLRNSLQCANEEYLRSLHLETVKPRRSSVYQDAYAAGDEYGNSMSLAPGKTAPHTQLSITQR